MNKTRFFIITTILLLVLNMVLLGSRFLKPEPHKRPREVVIERLNFDKNQIAKYDVLIKSHRTSVVDLESKIKLSKQHLYNQLLLEESQNHDSLVNEIATNHKKLEEVHLQHFMEIKSLCKPEQMNDYQAFVKDINKIFQPKKPHRPKD